MPKKILVIDDDEKLNRLLTEYLTPFGFSVSTVTDPHQGLVHVRTTDPDLVVLDVMLPGMDGFEVCRKIRKDSDVPIIMLTARGDVTDRIVGLEMGSDDYLPKPFEPRELVARIQSVLRRSSESHRSEKIRFQRLSIDPATHIVLLDDERLEVTTMEFDILLLFMKHPNRVLNRNFLLENLRGLDWEVYDRSIDVLVSRLRGRLNDDPRQPEFIRTVRGTGYQFIGECIEA